MHQFTWTSGQLTEVQRFINVPTRWCEQYPARERRELWLRTAGAEDLKLVVHTRAMPARSGHEVVGVLKAGQLVGLHNLSTGEAVNFERADPPLLWRRCDGMTVLLMLVVATAAVCAGWHIAGVLAGLLGSVFAPALLVSRWLQRCVRVRAIDAAIDSASDQATRRPGLVRIK